MMACTKLLLIALCLHAACAFTAAEVPTEAAPREQEEQEEVPAVLSPAINASQLAVPSGARGKYFRVRSRHSGYCIDVAYSNQAVGTPVNMYTCHDDANQLWTYDRVHGAMRSHLNDNKVLFIGSRTVVLNDFNVLEDREMFEPKSPVIYHGFSNRYVLGLDGASTAMLTSLIKGNDIRASHQRWTIEYKAPRLCYIRSPLNNKVWTITSAGSGARVELQSKSSARHQRQLWWEDSNGLIHSVANGEIVITWNWQLYTSVSANGQEWVKSGKYIYGLHSKGYRSVLEILGGSSRGTGITPMIKKPGSHQHWDFEYV